MEATDGFFAFRKEEILPGEYHHIEHLRDENRVFVYKRGAALPGSQLHTSLFGVGCPVHPIVIESCGHCAATEAIVEVERHQELAFDNWKGTKRRSEGGIFSATANELKPFTDLLL